MVLRCASRYRPWTNIPVYLCVIFCTDLGCVHTLFLFAHLRAIMDDSTPHILVVDDDLANATAVSRVLHREGWKATLCHKADDAIAELKDHRYDLVITDLKMPGGSGFELIYAAQHENIQVDFVVMTAFGTVENAVQALRIGAEDFIIKPIKRATLVKCVRRILRRNELEKENEQLRQRIDSMESRHDIIGDSESMRATIARAQSAARSEASVMLTGESGTGKEKFARAIHRWSPRHKAPFVVLHCGALPETLIESEIFGYEPGAFTGATKTKQGILELADGGTLFLDEIAELSPHVQVKLLRVLQSGDYTRLGSVQPRQLDVRVIAATHQDLPTMIKEGRFREDLFYRLNVIPVEIPPVRERGNDILLLAHAFLAQYSEKNGRSALQFSEETKKVLLNYAWPGNVRELQNIMQRLAVLAPGPIIESQDLPTEWENLKTAPQLLTFKVGTPMHQVERALILATLAHAGGDKTLTATLLGMGRRTIYRKLDEYQLDKAGPVLDEEP